MTAAPVARVGDTLSHGGNVTAGSPTIKANGQAVARLGDAVLCAQHGANSIVSASTITTAEGKGIARKGDLCACGATIISGSPDTNAG